MKKLILSVLAALGATFGLHAADGDTFSWEGLYYTITSETDKTCEVGKNGKGANDVRGDIVIPARVTGNGTEYTVTALGEDAFYANNGMTSISIPETVTKIRYRALSYCFDLKELTIPNSVTEMETRACYAINNLEHLTISSGLREIVRETFSGCPYLEEIVIPDGVVTIHEEAFNYCARATSLKIGASVTSIGKMAFSGCAALEAVSIPASVRIIGEEAFSYCPSIASVTIEDGDGSVSFGKNVFGDPTYAHDYTVMSKIVTVNLLRDFTWATDNNRQAPFACKPTLTTVNIGGSLTSVPGGSFAESTDITAVNVDLATCPSADDASFPSEAYAGATLTVPETALGTYRDHAVWSRFAHIEGKSEHPDKPWLISAASMELEAGKTGTLSAVAAEEGYEPSCDISWSSTDVTVASVSTDGLVTAVAPGEADIEMSVSTSTGVCYLELCHVTVTGNSGSITSVGIADESPCTLYDLNGRPVSATPLPGIYIVRRAGGKPALRVIRH